MPIRSRSDLKRAADQAGQLLQEIQDYCEANDLNWSEVEEARIRFPRGWIRTASLQRDRLPFVRDGNLKHNLAYTLILSDVVLWLSLRTDLWGTPKEMLTKLYIFLIGSLCESISKDYLKGICGKNYKGRTEYLFSKGIIGSRLRDDLDWLWETRNKTHLFQLEQREYVNDYTAVARRRCVRAFRGLILSLRAHRESQEG